MPRNLFNNEEEPEKPAVPAVKETPGNPAESGKFSKYQYDMRYFWVLYTQICACLSEFNNAEPERLTKKLTTVSRSIYGWLRGEEFPPLDADTLTLPSEICVQFAPSFAWLIPTGPTLFCCEDDKWDTDGAIELISALWRGFSKSVPEQLQDVCVIDPGQMVRGRIGSMAKSRSDFVKAYRDGFYLKDGDDAPYRIRGLFNDRDIALFDEDLRRNQDKIQSYDREHFGAYTEDPDMSGYGDPDRILPIRRVNLYAYLHDKPPFLLRYHLVILIVPDQDMINYSTRIPQSMDYLANLIVHGITADFGILPVILTSRYNESQNSDWQRLVQAAARKGRTYNIDLRELKILENGMVQRKSGNET